MKVFKFISNSLSYEEPLFVAADTIEEANQIVYDYINTEEAIEYGISYWLLENGGTNAKPKCVENLLWTGEKGLLFI